METIVLAVLLGGLALASALFSAVETAFFSLQTVQIRRLQSARPDLATRLEGLLVNPRRALSPLVIVDSCVGFSLILLCLYGLRGLSPTTLPFWICVPMVFAGVILFTQLLPKVIALRTPFRVALFGLEIMGWLLPLLEPACQLLQQLCERLIDSLAPERAVSSFAFTDDELKTLVEIGAEEGELDPSESVILKEILGLRDQMARDNMTPRIDVFAIADDLTNAEAIPLLCSKRFHRVPVYANTPDNLLGVLDVKRFLLEPGTHYTEFLTPPSYVPETIKALDLLQGFLVHPQRLATVVDEFGGTEGVIAFRDVIEPILSEAIPSASYELYIENFGPGRLIAAGDVRLDDLSERLNVPLEVEGIETIGGLIFNRLGYLPKPGEQMELEGHRLTIRRASRNRIHEIMIEIPKTKPEPDSQD